MIGRRRNLLCGLAMLMMAGCLFVTADDEPPPLPPPRTGDGIEYAPYDPLDPGPDGQGQQTCNNVLPDGTCDNTTEVQGVACVCPFVEKCGADQLFLHCTDGVNPGDGCLVAWRACGHLGPDPENRFPDMQCIDGGPFGTGCYVFAEKLESGYMRHCYDMYNCAPPYDDVVTEDCVVIPEYIGWDSTVPPSQCRHEIHVGDDYHDVGSCIDAFSTTFEEWDAWCRDGQGSTSTTTTGGGPGCQTIRDTWNAQKTTNTCINACIDDFIDCVVNANCPSPVPQSCTDAYTSCITNC